MILKTISKILFVCLLLTTSFINTKAQKADSDVKLARIQTSAHTDACKAKIEKTLAYEKGVVKAELDQETQVLTVTYHSKKTKVADICKVIDNLGHTAKEIPNDEPEETQKK